MSDANYDTRVASAMNQVLEAERVAQSAIADCTRQGQESLEGARKQARTILERAHQRVVALHKNSECALEKGQVPQPPRTQSVSRITTKQLDHAHFEAAMDQLVQRLVSLENRDI